MLRKFPSSSLECPNTYSLSSLLATVSACVQPAVTFCKALQFVTSQKHFPSCVENNRVTLGMYKLRFHLSLVTQYLFFTGFTSLKLSQSFDIEVDFSNGFVAAQDSFEVVKVLGSNVNMEAIKKIAKMVKPGPDYIREVERTIESYLRGKESKLSQ